MKLNPNCLNSIKDFYTFGKTVLKEENIDSFILDTNILLSFVTKFDKVKLITNDNYILSITEKELFLNLLDRRKNKEPIAYIINNREFMGLDFYVDKNVLIPRPDTEILVTKIIDIIKENNLKSMLEIGTGSGCISISVAKFCSSLKITATDIDINALEISKRNATENNVLGNINFIKSNLFENIPHEKFDIIVSNPPYIKSDIVDTLDLNVKNFEPLLALDGGKDGLYFYKKITESSTTYLNEKGFIAFEIGYDQSYELENLLAKHNFNNIKTLKDYNGLNRVVYGTMIGEFKNDR